MSKAIITVDLGWGDAGKGTIVDALVRKYRSGLVVRFSGGSQCGHNVVTDDGVHHEFAQFNSGTFAGAATLLSKHVLVNPLDMLLEAEVLIPKVNRNPDPLNEMYVDERSLVTTSYHVALNRIKESVRAKRHGSCGRGIRETVVYAENNPRSAIRIKDLRDYETLRSKLTIMQLKLWAEATMLAEGSQLDFGQLFQILTDDVNVMAKRLNHAASWFKICTPETVNWMLNSESNLIFEASQGVLLDQDYGFRPHITKSSCTTVNAKEMLTEAGFDGEVFQLGITRTFMSKHGAGPFPTEDKDLTSLLQDKHNHFNPWQQNFRVGYLDIPALKYSVEANGGIDGLAITHLDVLDKKEIWKVCLGYQHDDLSTFALKVDGKGRQWQESLTRELQQVTCNSVYVKGERIPSLISSALNVPVEIISSGQKSCDKKFIGELDVRRQDTAGLY